jgi:hypothetical protein
VYGLEWGVQRSLTVALARISSLGALAIVFAACGGHAGDASTGDVSMAPAPPPPPMGGAGGSRGQTPPAAGPSNRAPPAGPSLGPESLQANRDRLVADLAKRMCTDACTLWAALNKSERYVFLMDTAYLAAPASRLYPSSSDAIDTALDHAVALYSINGSKAGEGVDGSGLGGNDYNRIYLGFDDLAKGVMRDFPVAQNLWVRSDDIAGPHAPFTQREMIAWYEAPNDIQTQGPQFHHWQADSDFSQDGINKRLGVCGNTDRSLTELTIAFDAIHDSDPLGDYAARGGYGWQIVDQHAGITANWSYVPTSCSPTPPVNTDPYGGGTFAGMGPSLVNGACTAPKLGSGC